MSVGIVAIREDPERIRQGCIDKGEDPTRVDRVLDLDQRRRAILAERDALRHERKVISEIIGISKELDDIIARLGL